jgi:hypothetical protein
MFLCLLFLGLAGVGEASTKIWDNAAHNAFTDLIRFNDRWYCCFREGKGHAAGAGVIRVLTSQDGKSWEAAAAIEDDGVDLRDPHLCLTPDGRLMLNGGAAFPASRDPVADHYSFVCFSKTGSDWTRPARVCNSWEWLWRVRWHKDTAYGVAYGRDPKAKARKYQATLYRSEDGLKYEPVARFDTLDMTEGTVAFDGDAMVCLQRRNGANAMLGRSEPPYTKWHWQQTDEYFGGPNLIRTPKGEWYAAGRMRRDGKSVTGVGPMDIRTGKLLSVRILPSGGDTSYPGLVWHEGRLWTSYYSSHEGKSAIYLDVD